jgi:hypothetical protein
LYLTGYHWARDDDDDFFMLANGETNDDFHFTGTVGGTKLQIGVRGTMTEYDLTPLNAANKLIFGYGCDVATATGSRIYQSIFGHDNQLPVVCGWDATIGVPHYSDAAKSPNLRFFDYLTDFANSHTAPPTGRLQWFYDNHPMELVNAWGHATRTHIPGNARARGQRWQALQVQACWW